MSLTDIFLHLANFLAPPLACALVLPVAARWLWRSQRARLDLWTQILLLWTLGMSVVFAELWGFGRDGKMMTYAVLVFTQATAQWLMMSGWRR